MNFGSECVVVSVRISETLPNLVGCVIDLSSETHIRITVDEMEVRPFYLNQHDLHS